jgi:hypothetical protein
MIKSQIRTKQKLVERLQAEIAEMKKHVDVADARQLEAPGTGKSRP